MAVAAFALVTVACTHATITGDEGGVPDFADAIVAAPTVIIGAAGVSPTVTHTTRLSSVTFENHLGVPHVVRAAPELGYGGCPELAGGREIAAGQSIEVSFRRDGLFFCAYAIAAHGDNRAFQGLLMAH